MTQSPVRTLCSPSRVDHRATSPQHDANGDPESGVVSRQSALRRFTYTALGKFSYGRVVPEGYEIANTTTKKRISNAVNIVCGLCVVVWLAICGFNCYVTFGKPRWAEFATHAIIFDISALVGGVEYVYLLQRIRRGFVPETNDDVFLLLELLDSVVGAVTGVINLTIAFVAPIRHKEIRTIS
ncbi:hypothetical protein TWF281_000867 [Arthrobotrys megalospora]